MRREELCGRHTPQVLKRKQEEATLLTPLKKKRWPKSARPRQPATQPKPEATTCFEASWAPFEAEVAKATHQTTSQPPTAAVNVVHHEVVAAEAAPEVIDSRKVAARAWGCKKSNRRKNTTHRLTVNPSTTMQLALLENGAMMEEEPFARLQARIGFWESITKDKELLRTIQKGVRLRLHGTPMPFTAHTRAADPDKLQEAMQAMLNRKVVRVLSPQEEAATRTWTPVFGVPVITDLRRLNERLGIPKFQATWQSLLSLLEDPMAYVDDVLLLADTKGTRWKRCTCWLRS